MQTSEGAYVSMWLNESASITKRKAKSRSNFFARIFVLIEASMQTSEGAYVSMWLNESASITKRKAKSRSKNGAVAQLGEHLPCTQGVRSSILLGSTNSRQRTKRSPDGGTAVIRGGSGMTNKYLKKAAVIQQIKALSKESFLIWSIQTFIKNLVKIEVFKFRAWFIERWFKV